MGYWELGVRSYSFPTLRASPAPSSLQCPMHNAQCPITIEPTNHRADFVYLADKGRHNHQCVGY